MAVIETTRFPRLARARHRAVGGFDDFGDVALFFWRALAATPRALTQYPKETLRLIAEIAMGTGALAMIGGIILQLGLNKIGYGHLIDAGIMLRIHCNNSSNANNARNVTSSGSNDNNNAINGNYVAPRFCYYFFLRLG